MLHTTLITTRRRSRGVIVGAVAALVCTTFGMAAPAVSATLGAPSGLTASAGGSSTPVLGWSMVRGATGYEVQADDDPSFGSPNFKATTANTRSVPNLHLPPGAIHWRVRATAGRDASSWTKSQVSVNPTDVPAPTHPANGATLQQPHQPPLLRWNGSRGAISYTVQLDGDSTSSAPRPTRPSPRRSLSLPPSRRATGSARDRQQEPRQS